MKRQNLKNFICGGKNTRPMCTQSMGRWNISWDDRLYRCDVLETWRKFRLFRVYWNILSSQGLVKEKTVQKENLSDSESNDSELKKKRDAADKPKGFAMGLDPEPIIDGTDSRRDLMFLMKWKDSNEVDLVLAKEANIKCSQIVIAFLWRETNMAFLPRK